MDRALIPRFLPENYRLAAARPNGPLAAMLAVMEGPAWAGRGGDRRYRSLCQPASRTRRLRAAAGELARARSLFRLVRRPARRRRAALPPRHRPAAAAGRRSRRARPRTRHGARHDPLPSRSRRELRVSRSAKAPRTEARARSTSRCARRPRRPHSPIWSGASSMASGGPRHLRHPVRTIRTGASTDQ